MNKGTQVVDSRVGWKQPGLSHFCSARPAPALVMCNVDACCDTRKTLTRFPEALRLTPAYSAAGAWRLLLTPLGLRVHPATQIKVKLSLFFCEMWQKRRANPSIFFHWKRIFGWLLPPPTKNHLSWPPPQRVWSCDSVRRGRLCCFGVMPFPLVDRDCDGGSWSSRFGS